MNWNTIWKIIVRVNSCLSHFMRNFYTQWIATISVYSPRLHKLIIPFSQEAKPKQRILTTLPMIKADPTQKILSVSLPRLSLQVANQLSRPIQNCHSNHTQISCKANAPNLLRALTSASTLIASSLVTFQSPTGLRCANGLIVTTTLSGRQVLNKPWRNWRQVDSFKLVVVVT